MVSETCEQNSAQMPNLQIVEHVGNLPVVVSALQQLGAIYGYTKESNSLVKFTLEKAENGVKITSVLAAPVVSKLPVATIDSFAVGQMEKLEQILPIITKPTPDLLIEAEQLYNTTVKPTVDRVSGVTDSIKNQVHYAATTSQETVRAIGQKGKDTIDTVAEVNRQGLQKVSDYSKAKVAGFAEFGENKLMQLLATKYGVEVAKQLNYALEKTEGYVDYYLPAAEENKDNKEEEENLSSKPWSHAGNIGKKAGKRLYAQSLKQMEKISMRSQEMVNKYNYTIDLIDYAKTHLDSGKKALQDGMVKSKDKMWSVWEQVNQSEDEIVNKETADDKMTLESRLIATARHLTTNIKHSLDSISHITGYLPAGLSSMYNITHSAINDVVSEFAKIKTVEDVKSATIASAKTLIESVKTFLETLLAYIRSLFPALEMKMTEENMNKRKEVIDEEKQKENERNAEENERNAEEKKINKEDDMEENEMKNTEEVKVAEDETFLENQAQEPPSHDQENEEIEQE